MPSASEWYFVLVVDIGWLFTLGYHWDTSDWVPVREDGGGAVGGVPDVRGRNRGDGDAGYHVARLLVSIYFCCCHKFYSSQQCLLLKFWKLNRWSHHRLPTHHCWRHALLSQHSRAQCSVWFKQMRCGYVYFIFQSCGRCNLCTQVYRCLYSDMLTCYYSRCQR